MYPRELILDLEGVGDGKPRLPASTRGSAFPVEGRLGAQLGRGVPRRVLLIFKKLKKGFKKKD